jgi:hypothetical protein
MRTGSLQPKSVGSSGNFMSFTADSQYTKINAESTEQNVKLGSIKEPKNFVTYNWLSPGNDNSSDIIRTGIIVKFRITTFLNLKTNDMPYLRYFLNKVI